MNEPTLKSYYHYRNVLFSTKKRSRKTVEMTFLDSAHE